MLINNKVLLGDTHLYTVFPWWKYLINVCWRGGELEGLEGRREESEHKKRLPRCLFWMLCISLSFFFFFQSSVSFPFLLIFTLLVPKYSKLRRRLERKKGVGKGVHWHPKWENFRVKKIINWQWQGDAEQLIWCISSQQIRSFIFLSKFWTSYLKPWFSIFFFNHVPWL